MNFIKHYLVNTSELDRNFDNNSLILDKQKNQLYFYNNNSLNFITSAENVSSETLINNNKLYFNKDSQVIYFNGNTYKFFDGVTYSIEQGSSNNIVILKDSNGKNCGEITITIDNATTTAAGLMSPEDKQKINGIDTLSTTVTELSSTVNTLNSDINNEGGIKTQISEIQEDLQNVPTQESINNIVSSLDATVTNFTKTLSNVIADEYNAETVYQDGNYVLKNNYLCKKNGVGPDTRYIFNLPSSSNNMTCYFKYDSIEDYLKTLYAIKEDVLNPLYAGAIDFYYKETGTQIENHQTVLALFTSTSSSDSVQAKLFPYEEALPLIGGSTIEVTVSGKGTFKAGLTLIDDYNEISNSSKVIFLKESIEIAAPTETVGGTFADLVRGKASYIVNAILLREKESIDLWEETKVMNEIGGGSSPTSSQFIVLTQNEYDALTDKSDSILYLIKEA